MIVPIYNMEQYLGECLRSIEKQTRVPDQVVLVNDGSTDSSAKKAEKWADRHNRRRTGMRVEVVHTTNQGLGAARNTGLRHATCDLLAFVDSDDRLPKNAYETMTNHLTDSGSDFVVGSCKRFDAESGRLGWMSRLHRPARVGITVAEHPEILGDVFAWNKVFRREFWERAGLSFAEGVRYEDAPATTRAYLSAARFDVIDDIVYHWRARSTGDSITQTRATLTDLRDRHHVRAMTWQTVHELASSEIQQEYLKRVLPGDLPRYFSELSNTDDAYARSLATSLAEFYDGRNGITFADTAIFPGQRTVGALLVNHLLTEAKALSRMLTERTRAFPTTVTQGRITLRLDRIRDGLQLEAPAEVIAAATLRPKELRANWALHSCVYARGAWRLQFNGSSGRLPASAWRPALVAGDGASKHASESDLASDSAQVQGDMRSCQVRIQTANPSQPVWLNLGVEGQDGGFLPLPISIANSLTEPSARVAADGSLVLLR